MNNRLSAGRHGGGPLPPIPRCHEARPVEGVGGEARGSAGLQELEVGLVHRVDCRGTLDETMAVERGHPLTGGVVVDRPETHDDRAGTGDLEGAAKAEDPFPSQGLTDPGFAA